MYFIRNLLFSTIIISSIASLVHAQPDTYYQEYDTTGEAYAQSSFNSHWSALVPVALLVGAAIWFGVADGNSSDDLSISPKNGLGRLGSKSYSSSSNSRSSRSRSYSGHY